LLKKTILSVFTPEFPLKSCPSVKVNVIQQKVSDYENVIQQKACDCENVIQQKACDYENVIQQKACDFENSY
jgi:hypothetical protein